MITAFKGVCHTCGVDHDNLSLFPSENQYFEMYAAQCQLTDELSKKLEEKSDQALLDRIKELEGLLAKANQRIASLNSEYLQQHITYGGKQP